MVLSTSCSASIFAYMYSLPCSCPAALICFLFISVKHRRNLIQLYRIIVICWIRFVPTLHMQYLKYGLTDCLCGRHKHKTFALPIFCLREKWKKRKSKSVQQRRWKSTERDSFIPSLCFRSSPLIKSNMENVCPSLSSEKHLPIHSAFSIYLFHVGCMKIVKSI